MKRRSFLSLPFCGLLAGLFAKRDEDPTPKQMLAAVEQSGTLDFWNDPAEDVYGETFTTGAGCVQARFVFDGVTGKTVQVG